MSLDRFVPFSDRLHWLMLKTALDEDMKAETIASRLGWSMQKVRQIVWGNPRNLHIDCIAQWFFACNGSMPRFSIVPVEC